MSVIKVPCVDTISALTDTYRMSITVSTSIFVSVYMYVFINIPTCVNTYWYIYLAFVYFTGCLFSHSLKNDAVQLRSLR